MLSIQCSEVVRGQVTLKWKPNINDLDPFIRHQIGTNLISLLIRIESKDDTWHESVDINQGEYTTFLRSPGEQTIKVFPVRLNRLHKEDPVEKIPVGTFENRTYPNGDSYFQSLNLGFSYWTSLIKKIEFDENKEFTCTALDNIVHFSFTRIASLSHFASYNWADRLISDVWDTEPKNLCQRRIFIGPMLVARIIAFGVY
jgi:hypothetical protein